jgi:hypothetical protein
MRGWAEIHRNPWLPFQGLSQPPLAGIPCYGGRGLAHSLVTFPVRLGHWYSRSHVEE